MFNGTQRQRTSKRSCKINWYRGVLSQHNRKQSYEGVSSHYKYYLEAGAGLSLGWSMGLHSTAADMSHAAENVIAAITGTSRRRRRASERVRPCSQRLPICFQAHAHTMLPVPQTKILIGNSTQKLYPSVFFGSSSTSAQSVLCHDKSASGSAGACIWSTVLAYGKASKSAQCTSCSRGGSPLVLSIIAFSLLSVCTMNNWSKIYL
jgi:hypothetical protein